MNCKHKSMQGPPNSSCFLRTRGKSLDEGNWGKLKRIIKYLNDARQLTPTMLEDNLRIIHWYVDSSYAIHPEDILVKS